MHCLDLCCPSWCLYLETERLSRWHAASCEHRHLHWSLWITGLQTPHVTGHVRPVQDWHGVGQATFFAFE